MIISSSTAEVYMVYMLLYFRPKPGAGTLGARRAARSSARRAARSTSAPAPAVGVRLYSSAACVIVAICLLCVISRVFLVMFVYVSIVVLLQSASPPSEARKQG